MSAQSVELVYKGVNLLHARTHSIQDQAGRLDLPYLIVGDSTRTLPLVVFLAGSAPSPLLIRNEGVIIPIFTPFNPMPLLERYHLLVIGKPGVPLVATMNELDPSLSYIDAATGQAPAAFTTRNRLDFYMSTYPAILKKALAQGWIDPSKVVLVGHSQGARVAAHIAARNRKVTHLAFLSCDPLGRQEDILRSELRRTPEAFSYPDLLAMYSAKTSPAYHDVHARNNRSWSDDLTPLLLQAKARVLVGFGTEDPSCLTCPHIAIAFAKAGKENLDFRPYKGLDHNYMSLDAEGKPDPASMAWDQVMADILQWAGQ